MSRLVVQAAQADDLPGIGEGVARAFEYHGEDAAWMRERWPQSVLRRPGFRVEQSRVGRLHDHIVSHAMVDFFTLNYGRARIRCAGIGKVYTERGYRKRGLAAEVMRDALTYGMEQGAELALLNGVRGYYERFGFTPVWPTYEAQFHTNECAALPAPLILREPEPHETRQIAALYNRHWGGRVAFERSPHEWMWRVSDPDQAIRVWVAAHPYGGRVEGYLAARRQTSSAVEVVADTEAAAQTLLATAAQQHQALGRDCFRWLLPPDDALIEYARQSVRVEVSACYAPDGGWCGRLLNAAGLLRRLLPEITEQARVMMPNLSEDMLYFTHLTNGIEIGLRGHPQTAARLNLRDFVQLLFGTLNPAALHWRYGLTQESLRLLQVLFPPRLSAIGYWDWF